MMKPRTSENDLSQDLGQDPREQIKDKTRKPKGEVSLSVFLPSKDWWLQKIHLKKKAYIKGRKDDLDCPQRELDQSRQRNRWQQIGVCNFRALLFQSSVVPELFVSLLPLLQLGVCLALTFQMQQRPLAIVCRAPRAEEFHHPELSRAASFVFHTLVAEMKGCSPPAQPHPAWGGRNRNDVPGAPCYQPK